MNIGDKLYRRVEMSGIWEYEVFAVHDYGTVKQYSVRCAPCNHGWKCELLVAEDNKGNFVYVSMLNNDEDNDQTYWHTNGPLFRKTKDEAKRDSYLVILRHRKEMLAKAQSALKQAEKDVAEMEILLEDLPK